MDAEFCQKLFLHLLKLSNDFIFYFVNMVYHMDWFPSTDELIKKLRHIYTMEYYSATKRNAFESVLIEVNEPRAYYTE